MSRLRRSLYRAGSILGDVEAAERGPAAFEKRVLRKAIYRRTGTTTRRLLRALGL